MKNTHKEVKWIVCLGETDGKIWFEDMNAWWTCSAEERRYNTVKTVELSKAEKLKGFRRVTPCTAWRHGFKCSKAASIDRFADAL